MPEFYDYDVNADGSLSTTVRLGASDSPRWRRSVADGLGRVLREESPSPAPGGGVSVRQHHYNAKGRLVRTTRPGLADERIDYDELGRPELRGLDLGGSDSLVPASVDRIVETKQSYEQADGGWWEVSEQRDYLIDGDDTPTLLSRTRRRLDSQN